MKYTVEEKDYFPSPSTSHNSLSNVRNDSGFHMEQQEDTVQVNEKILFCKFYSYIEYSWIKQIPIQSLIIYRARSKIILYEPRAWVTCGFPGKIVVETVWNKSAKD